jgi:hypothetical protein
MDYNDYIFNNLSYSIKYTEYIANNLDKTIKYAEYIADNLDSSITFNEYLLREDSNKKLLELRSKKIEKIKNNIKKYDNK